MRQRDIDGFEKYYAFHYIYLRYRARLYYYTLPHSIDEARLRMPAFAISRDYMNATYICTLDEYIILLHDAILCQLLFPFI